MQLRLQCYGEWKPQKPFSWTGMLGSHLVPLSFCSCHYIIWSYALSSINYLAVEHEIVFFFCNLPFPPGRIVVSADLRFLGRGPEWWIVGVNSRRYRDGSRMGRTSSVLPSPLPTSQSESRSTLVNAKFSHIISIFSRRRLISSWMLGGNYWHRCIYWIIVFNST